MQVVDPQRYEKPRSSTTYLYVDFQYVKDLFSSFCAPKKQKNTSIDNRITSNYSCYLALYQ